MRNENKIAVIIPALNEEKAIGNVIDAIPDWADEILVVDNGSKDSTCATAEAHGAKVIVETHRGYGSACLKGIDEVNDPDIVVFLDGDFSDYPEEMGSLVDPIINDEAEMVIGSRALGENEAGALTPQARFGNRLACFLMRIFWGVKHTDLGPFRAIRFTTLISLGMKDPDYGWTVEMQIKAAIQGIKSVEVPVKYRRRTGKSKISGTISGVIGAGTKILSTIFLSALRQRKEGPQELLAIFTRYPIPGKTKTRLIPALGEEGAAKLQQEMTETVLKTTHGLDKRSNLVREVCFTHGNIAQMREWLGDDSTFNSQGNGDLGEKMKRTFTNAFKAGTKRAVIIGTDCPSITKEILDMAFEGLKQHDLVLGPANDGGYYLIGFRRDVQSSALSDLFNEIPWGTDKVLAETKKKASNYELTVAELEILSDIDLPEDLERI